MNTVPIGDFSLIDVPVIAKRELLSRDGLNVGVLEAGGNLYLRSFLHASGRAQRSSTVGPHASCGDILEEELCTALAESGVAAKAELIESKFLARLPDGNIVFGGGVVFIRSAKVTKIKTTLQKLFPTVNVEIVSQ